MKMIPMESSNLKAAGWSSETGLVVEFKNGTSYIYPSVPEEIFTDLRKANSKGQFFNAKVRGNPNFFFAKLEPGADLVVAARNARRKAEADAREAGAGGAVASA